MKVLALLLYILVASTHKKKADYELVVLARSVLEASFVELRFSIHNITHIFWHNIYITSWL